MDALTSAIFGGLISKIINDITDVSDIKNKIVNAVKNKKNKNQNPESQIYNIIVDALNEFTYNNYKNNQDRIFDGAEILFKGFKVGEDEAIRLCFQNLNLDNNENEIQRFKVALCETLGKTEYRELYCAILLLILTKRNQLDITLVEKLDEILERLRKESNKEEYFKSKPKSRTQGYLDVWNKDMFLNHFTEWDEKRGVNIKLSDVYIKDHLPHFLYGDNPKEFNNIDELLSRHIYQSGNDNKMLLILGQPGIGKSTLITWMLNNFKDRIDDILVYQFASDLKDVPWGNFVNGRILLEELGLSYDNLEGKVLILDGFDEIDVKKDRKSILDTIYGDLIYKKNVKNFTLIITCREHYINNFERLRCKYIILQPWDEKQIESFCEVYNYYRNISKISDDSLRNIINNKDVLGVPLILYMVLALNITLEQESSIVDVYDKIFSLDGGLYDRCIDNRNFADQHRIGEIKRQIHQVSREIAFWMFENNSQEAVISQKEYQKICKKIAGESESKSLEQDFIIGNFYRLKHCEGVNTNELYFVHRTIYEYFVVEYMFSCIYENIESPKELAGIFGHFLKKERLSETICEFLKYKIQSSELKDKDNIIFDVFNLMLKDGMTYYTRMYYKNVIDCEMKVFVNMLEIIHLWDVINLKLDISACNYLKYNTYICLNLENLMFKFILIKSNKIGRAEFRNVYLEEANLSNVILSKADLRGADLRKANLRKACLRAADLRKADLRGADLRETDLQYANLEDADLRGANLGMGDLLRVKLRKAKLKNTNFGETNLDNLNLLDVNLNNARLGKSRE